MGGDPLFSGNFRMALENFDTNDDGLIDFDEFRNLNDRYPMILHPAFRMQDKLQKYTLGEHELLAKNKRVHGQGGRGASLITVGAVPGEVSAEVLRPPARGPRVHRLPIEDGAG